MDKGVSDLLLLLLGPSSLWLSFLTTLSMGTGSLEECLKGEERVEAVLKK